MHPRVGMATWARGCARVQHRIRTTGQFNVKCAFKFATRQAGIVLMPLPYYASTLQVHSVDSCLNGRSYIHDTDYQTTFNITHWHEARKPHGVGDVLSSVEEFRRTFINIDLECGTNEAYPPLACLGCGPLCYCSRTSQRCEFRRSSSVKSSSGI